MTEATDEEKAEYAACLTSSGAVSEALHLLESVDEIRYPQALLFRAYALIRQWNYEATVPLLLRYLNHAALDDYQRLVGKCNLAAALVHERKTKDAEILLEELRINTREKQLNLLYGSTLELIAQNLIAQRRWGETGKWLKEARHNLQHTGGDEPLFVRKWELIAQLFQLGGRALALRELHRFRSEAALARHWETVRECDLYTALVMRNEQDLLHVYWGTPFESYRRWLVREYGRSLAVPARYIWKLSGNGKKILSLLPNARRTVHWRLESADLPCQTLRALCADFYRPMTLAQMHALVYRGEFFNPISSPARIHQLIRRLRHYLKARRIPLVIEERASTYRLHACGNCAIELAPATEPMDRAVALILKLKNQYAKRAFSASAAGKALGVSSRTVRRAIEPELQTGEVTALGSGPHRRYAFRR